MRAKIASRAKGHALEDRFLRLNPIQLRLLYRQAIEEEEEEKKEQVELIKTINDIWLHNLSAMFKELQLFTNPKMYQAMLEVKELEQYREEVKAEDFPKMWEEMMKVVPKTFIVEDVVSEYKGLPDISPEEEALFAGWVPSKFREDGGE